MAGVSGWPLPGFRDLAIGMVMGISGLTMLASHCVRFRSPMSFPTWFSGQILRLNPASKSTRGRGPPKAPKPAAWGGRSKSEKMRRLPIGQSVGQPLGVEVAPWGVGGCPAGPRVVLSARGSDPLSAAKALPP